MALDAMLLLSRDESAASMLFELIVSLSVPLLVRLCVCCVSFEQFRVGAVVDGEVKKKQIQPDKEGTLHLKSKGLKQHIKVPMTHGTRDQCVCQR